MYSVITTVTFNWFKNSATTYSFFDSGTIETVKNLILLYINPIIVTAIIIDILKYNVIIRKWKPMLLLFFNNLEDFLILYYLLIKVRKRTVV